MRAMGGRVAIKTGAEAVFVAILPELKRGVALKITDGTTRAAEAAIAEATKAERNRLWREENRAALEAYAEEVAREGLALASYRTF